MDSCKTVIDWGNLGIPTQRALVLTTAYAVALSELSLNRRAAESEGLPPLKKRVKSEQKHSLEGITLTLRGSFDARTVRVLVHSHQH